MRPIPILLLLALSLAAGHARAADKKAGPDWPVWRGPNFDGISPETGWDPAKLSGGPKVVWKTNVGRGWSAVAVEGDALYTMGNDGKNDEVFRLALDTGEVVWKHAYPSAPKDDYPGPRATPVVADGRVYTLGREGELLCLDAARGRVLWQRNLVSEFKAQKPTWFISGSVRVEGRAVLVNAGETGMAFDARSGKPFWTSKGRGGYSTPVVFDLGKRKTVALFGEKSLVAVDLATGTRIWSHDWVTGCNVNAADPIVLDGRVYISSGYGKGCAVLDISRGAPSVVWQNTEMASHFGSSVVIDGHAYGPHGNAGSRGAGLRCIDLANGDRTWDQPLGFCSLTAADGKLIVINERGELFVAQSDPSGWRELARCQALEARGAKCWTMPVLCRSRIYCRNSLGDLVSLDVAK